MKPLVSLIPEPDRSTDDRKAIPEAWKAASRARSGGVCAWPGCEVTGPFEYDHALCLGIGGKHANDNIQPLCVPHHKIKTRRDKGLIAKAKRIEARDTGTRRPRKKIPSPGFTKPEGHKHQWPKTPWPKRTVR